jgi:hypothetical protein
MSVTQLIARKLQNYGDVESFGSRMRAKRLPPFVEMIDDVYREHGRVDIIDVGGTRGYLNVIPEAKLRKRHVHITIVNLPGE